MLNKNARWVWTDLEMTGLDERHDVILEAAVLVTDPSLEVLAQGHMTIHQPSITLDVLLSPFVRAMHTKNGLLARVAASQNDLAALSKLFVKTLTDGGVKPHQGILAGNTIRTDRAFLDAHLPEIGKVFLHYRSIDVSSIKTVFRDTYGVECPKQESDHTAMADILASIAELRWYKEKAFALDALEVISRAQTAVKA
jgi:oligoribonuclease